MSSWPSAHSAAALVLLGALALAPGCRWKDDNPQPAPLVEGTPPSFAPLVRRVLPSVVGVYTTTRDLEQSLGSGVIIDSDGHVLTNEHVVGERGDIKVRFYDGHRADARLIGRDAETDVALLAVERERGRSFTPAALGDSDRIEVGEWVIAIGQPFGLSHSVTAGILSAKGRTALDMQAESHGHGYWYYLQTDASINPGNSGGPLIDLRGTVVGINTMIHQEQRVSRVGFAIPVSLIKMLLPRLESQGVVVRSWIGVEAVALDPDEDAAHGVPGGHGVLVREVKPQSPAVRAGLQKGDVILSFDGRPIDSDAELRWYAAMAGPGRSVPLSIFRHGKTEKVTVRLERKPEDRPRAER
jgi:serine protease Do